MRRKTASFIVCMLVCMVSIKSVANDRLMDTTGTPPFATNNYSDSFYNNVLSAAMGIAQPYLLQQGNISLPGVTVVDTSLVYDGVKYPTSNLYYTPRTIANDGFYIAANQLPYYGAGKLSVIWPKECPNIFYDSTKTMFQSHTDCIGFGVRVLAAVGGTSVKNNAYLSFANGILKANICHFAAIGRAPNSYEMATSFATLGSNQISGWTYISGNLLLSSVNKYNHAQDSTLGVYNGGRKGGFGLSMAGDMLSFGDGPLSSSNGHTMFMANNPGLLNSTSLKTFFPTLSSSKINTFLSKNKVYQVNVYDDCDHLHYNDSRATSKITGIGYGTILIVTDTLDDAPIGYFFTPSTSLTYTPLDTSKTYCICVARYTASGPLPLKITSFAAVENNNIIEGNWQTVNELNTNSFAIQRSNDGVNFTNIGIVKATGIGANNYRFTDNNPINGINYYRLQSVDKDGEISYSKVVSILFQVKNNKISVYPTLSKNGVVNIKMSDVVTGKGAIRVFDLNGRILQTSAINITNGTSILPYKINNSAKGTYILQIETTIDKQAFKVVIE